MSGLASAEEAFLRTYHFYFFLCHFDPELVEGEKSKERFLTFVRNDNVESLTQTKDRPFDYAE